MLELRLSVGRMLFCINFYCVVMMSVARKVITIVGQYRKKIQR
jgi:hypothetical protein